MTANLGRHFHIFYFHFFWGRKNTLSYSRPRPSLIYYFQISLFFLEQLPFCLNWSSTDLSRLVCCCLVGASGTNRIVPSVLTAMEIKLIFGLLYLTFSHWNPFAIVTTVVANDLTTTFYCELVVLIPTLGPFHSSDGPDFLPIFDSLLDPFPWFLSFPFFRSIVTGQVDCHRKTTTAFRSRMIIDYWTLGAKECRHRLTESQSDVEIWTDRKMIKETQTKWIKRKKDDDRRDGIEGKWWWYIK